MAQSRKKNKKRKTSKKVNQPAKLGHFSEYLNKGLKFPQIEQERKAMLKQISSLMNEADVLVFAADFQKVNTPIAIGYDDLLPIEDQLHPLQGTELCLILETPGGSGTSAENIVRLIRKKYNKVSIIVPGKAMSAGTLIAMAADDILMDSFSSLGPIDAQIAGRSGKAFSAHALITAFEEIKEKADKEGRLNLAYVPMLQSLSPGELEHARNAMAFAIERVKEWLVEYKFRDWTHHSSTGNPVTQEEKEKRANEIAEGLNDHAYWRSHGRSVKIEDLRRMKLKITDFSENPKLYEAIKRYYVLLDMTLHGTEIYKLFETPSTHIYRHNRVAANSVRRAVPGSVNLNVPCNNCGMSLQVQGKFKKETPDIPGHLKFPVNNMLKCPGCGVDIDLSNYRKEIESETKQRIISDG